MWLSKLFGKKETEDIVSEEKEDNTFELKIQDAVNKCKNDRISAEKEISNMMTWAEDAIMEIYADYFENAHLSYYREKYRDGLLDKYAKIKEEHGPKIDNQMVMQCDKIVSGYINQASMLMSKVKLFEKLENEHKHILSKLRTAQEKISKMKKLDKHSNRLEEMNSDTKHLSASIAGGYELEEINREFMLKEEYYNQLEMLNQEYGSDEHFDNALDYKKEVDKMVDNM